jgi:glutaredoxin-related protein
MDIQELIKKQVSEHPVVLYMKGSPDFPQCGFSANAVRILEACGVKDLFTVPKFAKASSNTPTGRRYRSSMSTVNSLAARTS